MDDVLDGHLLSFCRRQRRQSVATGIRCYPEAAAPIKVQLDELEILRFVTRGHSLLK